MITPYRMFPGFRKVSDKSCTKKQNMFYVKYIFFSKIVLSKIITRNRKKKKGQRNTYVHKDPGVVYGQQVQHRQNQCSSKKYINTPPITVITLCRQRQQNVTIFKTLFWWTGFYIWKTKNYHQQSKCHFIFAFNS
jgi:hypothetical protein